MNPPLHAVKGHGTRNDFVLVDGRDGLELTPDLARALADRRGGVGGDGVRVFAAWLERLGLWKTTDELVVGTRAGVKRVRREDGPDGDPWYAVDMGPWFLPDGQAAVEAGGDV